MRNQSTEVRLCACGRVCKRRSVCDSCRHEQRLLSNPFYVVYHKLRSNARRRGVQFLLTLDEFIAEIKDTEYLEKRGRGREDLTIDRKVNALGYRAGNLQVIPNYMNARKGSSDWGEGMVDRGECPF